MIECENSLDIADSRSGRIAISQVPSVEQDAFESVTVIVQCYSMFASAARHKLNISLLCDMINEI